MRKQLSLNLYKGKRGGRRPNSGRRRIHSPGVAHRTREIVKERTALHINVKIKAYIRNKLCLQILKKAIKNARSHGLRIIHFSLQTNHLHLIIEATNNEILTRGMRSLTITFAKGVAKGRIQLERYHLHVLKTKAETKNAIHYVLFNEQKHAGLKVARVDAYSSLGFVKDLKALAKRAGKTIVLGKKEEENFLDYPRGWMMRQYL